MGAVGLHGRIWLFIPTHTVGLVGGDHAGEARQPCKCKTVID